MLFHRSIDDLRIVKWSFWKGGQTQTIVGVKWNDGRICVESILYIYGSVWYNLATDYSRPNHFPTFLTIAAGPPQPQSRSLNKPIPIQATPRTRNAK